MVCCTVLHNFKHEYLRSRASRCLSLSPSPSSSSDLSSNFTTIKILMLTSWIPEFENFDLLRLNQAKQLKYLQSQQQTCMLHHLNILSTYIYWRKNSIVQLFQCISKIFCNSYNLERMSPSLIVRKPKPYFVSLNFKSDISHFSVWVL